MPLLLGLRLDGSRRLQERSRLGALRGRLRRSVAVSDGSEDREAPKRVSANRAKMPMAGWASIHRQVAGIATKVATAIARPLATGAGFGICIPLNGSPIEGG